jgi:hypothetical protein
VTVGRDSVFSRPDFKFQVRFQIEITVNRFRFGVQARRSESLASSSSSLLRRRARRRCQCAPRRRHPARGRRRPGPLPAHCQWQWRLSSFFSVSSLAYRDPAGILKIRFLIVMSPSQMSAKAEYQKSRCPPRPRRPAFQQKWFVLCAVFCFNQGVGINDGEIFFLTSKIFSDYPVETKCRFHLKKYCFHDSISNEPSTA